MLDTKIIFEHRSMIVLAALIVLIVSIPIFALLFELITCDYLPINIQTLPFLLLIGIACFICIWTFFYYLIKFLHPAKIILSLNGIKCAGVKEEIKWDDIREIKHVKLCDSMMSFTQKISLILALLMSVPPPVLLYVMTKFLILNTSENQKTDRTICIALKNGKEYILSIDGGLCRSFKEGLSEDELLVDIINNYRNKYS